MKFAAILGCFLTVISAWAQRAGAPEAGASIVAARFSWPLEVETVRSLAQQAIRAVDLSGARIIPPPDFRTRTRNPQLELRRMQQDAKQGEFFLTLRCRRRSDCGSFVVEVLSVNGHSNSAGGSNRELLPVPFSSAVGSRGQSISAAGGPVLVEPHTLARLVIEEDGLRITESVVPGKRGRLGER